MKRKKIHFPTKQDEFSKMFKRTFLLVLLICIAFFALQFLVVVFSTSPPCVLNSSVFHQHLGDSFRDFFYINIFIKDFSPYIQAYSSSYPPLNFVFALPFMLMQGVSTNLALTIYLIVEALMLLILILCVKQKFNLNVKTTIVLSIICVISAPFLFLIERGNYLFFTFFFVVIFFLYRNSENKALKEFALISLAIASAMKMYPAIFAIFLIKDKQFKEFFRTVLYAIILFFLPFFMLKGGFFENITMFVENLKFFTSIERLSVDVSFTNLFRIFAYILGVDYLNSTLNLGITILKWGLTLCIIIALFASRDKWKTSALCAFLIALFPHPSSIYAMVFCLIAFILFIQKPKFEKIDIFYAVLFTFILIPFQFGFIIQPVTFASQYLEIPSVQPNYMGLTINVLLESLALTIFAIALIVDAVKKTPKQKISLKDYVKEEVVKEQDFKDKNRR